MCLAVPGKVLFIEGDDPVFRHGAVDFAGVRKDVSLAYVPDAKPGDYVMVHVGFALSIVDEMEAQRVFEALRELDQLAEIEEPPA